MASVLFITRSWQGTGGLQQLSRDLWRGMQNHYGADAALCAFSGPNLLLPFFGIRAFCRGILAARMGVRLHGGDASISILLAAVKWFVPHAHCSVTAAGLDVIYPNAAYQWMLARSVRCMDVVCCISAATAEVVHNRGIPPERIRTIPCGIWPEDAAPSVSRTNPAPHLVSIGRLVPRKGVVWFVREVMPHLLQTFPSLHLSIAGSGPEESVIRETITALHLQKHVSLLGVISDAQRSALLHEADVFVMPVIPKEGDMEGFGIVCLEAGRAGIPTAGAAIGGVMDAMIDGVTGRFFQPGNSEDCVRVITELLRNPLVRVAISRATLERYSWERLMTRYHQEVFEF